MWRVLAVALTMVGGGGCHVEESTDYCTGGGTSSGTSGCCASGSLKVVDNFYCTAIICGQNFITLLQSVQQYSMAIVIQ